MLERRESRIRTPRKMAGNHIPIPLGTVCRSSRTSKDINCGAVDNWQVLTLPSGTHHDPLRPIDAAIL
jgi:hypothetical protein